MRSAAPTDSDRSASEQYLIVNDAGRDTVIYRLQDLFALRAEKVRRVRRAIARNEYDEAVLLDRALDSLSDAVCGN